VFRAFASALAGSQMKERSTGRQYRTTSRLAPIASRGVEHAKRVPSNAAALVLPEPFGNYWRALSRLPAVHPDKPVYRRRRFTICGTRSPSTVRTRAAAAAPEIARPLKSAHDDALHEARARGVLCRRRGEGRGELTGCGEPPGVRRATGAVRTGIGWLDGVPPPKVPPLVYSQPRPAVAVT
jgi:hypothetical protein